MVSLGFCPSLSTSAFCNGRQYAKFDFPRRASRFTSSMTGKTPGGTDTDHEPPTLPGYVFLY